MTTLVVDASVAAKWLIAELDSEVAVGFLAHDLIAPAILRLECANALLRRLRLRQLSPEETATRLRGIADLPVALHAVDDALPFEMAMRLRHPVYDCLYLALAETQAVPLITADREFRDKAVAAGIGDRIRLMDEAPSDQP